MSAPVVEFGTHFVVLIDLPDAAPPSPAPAPQPVAVIAAEIPAVAAGALVVTADVPVSHTVVSIDQNRVQTPPQYAPGKNLPSISRFITANSHLGIPGPYAVPPLAPNQPMPKKWYVVTKGTQVGIFGDWYGLVFFYIIIYAHSRKPGIKGLRTRLAIRDRFTKAILVGPTQWVHIIGLCRVDSSA